MGSKGPPYQFWLRRGPFDETLRNINAAGSKVGHTVMIRISSAKQPSCCLRLIFHDRSIHAAIQKLPSTGLIFLMHHSWKKENSLVRVNLRSRVVYICNQKDWKQKAWSEVRFDQFPSDRNYQLNQAGKKKQLSHFRVFFLEGLLASVDNSESFDKIKLNHNEKHEKWSKRISLKQQTAQMLTMLTTEKRPL